MALLPEQMGEIGARENTDVGSGKECEGGMGKAAGRGYRLLHLFSRCAKLSQVKQAAPQKNVAGPLQRRDAFAARGVDAFLSQPPRFFQVAAHDMESPGSGEQ